MTASVSTHSHPNSPARLGVDARKAGSLHRQRQHAGCPERYHFWCQRSNDCEGKQNGSPSDRRPDLWLGDADADVAQALPVMHPSHARLCLTQSSALHMVQESCWRVQGDMQRCKLHPPCVCGLLNRALASAQAAQAAPPPSAAAHAYKPAGFTRGRMRSGTAGVEDAVQYTGGGACAVSQGAGREQAGACDGELTGKGWC